MLRVLLGLLPKEAGEIHWNGQLVEEPASFFIPPRSAYPAQVPRLFSDTLQENLLLGLPEAKVDLVAAIRAAVLEQDLSELEKGLDTLVGPKGVKLSRGQIQCSATARMFVRDPELLVFDDLSSALDWRPSVSCGSVYLLVDELLRGTFQIRRLLAGSFPIAGQCFGGSIRSLCSRTDRSLQQVCSTHYWQPVRK